MVLCDEVFLVGLALHFPASPHQHILNCQTCSCLYLLLWALCTFCWAQDLSNEQVLKSSRFTVGRKPCRCGSCQHSAQTWLLGSRVEGDSLKLNMAAVKSCLKKHSCLEKFAFVSHDFAIVNTLYLLVDYSDIFC